MVLEYHGTYTCTCIAILQYRLLEYHGIHVAVYIIHTHVCTYMNTMVLEYHVLEYVLEYTCPCIRAYTHT
jgi:hypothetical protein